MHNRKTVFMFSGQGSQYYRMGQPLYEHNRVFRSWMDYLDGVCRDACGKSAIELIYDPAKSRADVFQRTPLSGPAIFMVEYATAKALEAAGVYADLTLGASLGTYAAAAVSGALRPEDAIVSILGQAPVLERHCPPGGMLAIMADLTLFQAPEIRQRAELAAVNFESHFVVAALEDELGHIERFVAGHGASAQRLPVSVAFHSRWIDAARGPLQPQLDGVSLAALQVPLVCCAHARTFTSFPQDFLWKVIRDPIAFRDTIAMLERTGPYRYVDVGPSGTLAGFLRYLLPPGSGSQAQKVLSPFGGEIRSFETVTSSGSLAPSM